jgi:mannose-1-phosphate guanylyltransferase
MTAQRSAILLVGGMGTRLQPLTFSTPKPLLKVAGVPFTERQIARAIEAGVNEVVLATSFKAELFEPYFGDGSKWGISIKYAVETEPLGTGGAIRNAASMLTGDGPVAIFNGDVLSEHDLTGQFKYHEAQNADVTLYLTEVADARAFGAVELDAESRVLAFNEKMENPPTNIINAGCYTFSRSVFSAIPQERVVSVERETFPSLLSNGAKVFGFVDRSYWLDIGTPAALMAATRHFLTAESNDGRGNLIHPTATIHPTSIIEGASVIGAGAAVGAAARITGSIVGEGALVGERATVVSSFVADGAEIAAGSYAEENFLGFLHT